jgi:predicted nucleotidyltransferase
MSAVARHRAALREATIARLVTHFAAHPPAGAERVILFGSVARGDFDGASDLDLLVVGTTRPEPSVHDAAERAVEVLLWPPAQWARAVAGDNPFMNALRREGVELWRAEGIAPLR